MNILVMILVGGILYICYKQPAVIPLVIIYSPLAFCEILNLDGKR